MSASAYPVTRSKEESVGARRSPWLATLLNMDGILLALVVGMAVLGLVVLRGATAGIVAAGASPERQALFLAIALGALAVTALLDYRWLSRAAIGLYVMNLAALVFVLAGGSKIKGARSWIDLGPVNWQPSETMKIATVLVCAQWLALRPEAVNSWRGLVGPGLICGLPTLLILMQPDLGTASLFFALLLTMLLMAGVDRRFLLTIICGSLLGMAACYPLLKPYQKERILVFLDPERDPRGTGYNVIQAKIAVGNGGVFGQGWGKGSQSSQGFLPEQHTDFIFASSIEQFGLLGGLVLLAGFALLLWRMVRAMDRARDRFGSLAVAGLIAVVGSHLLLNCGMNIGLLPVTGIPLPLMSYGGSFLVTTFVLFGIVLNVSSRRFVLAA